MPAAAGRGTATRACRQITVRLGGNDFSYRIVIVSGRISCVIARKVMRLYITRNYVALRGWICFRGHSSVPWAASCAGGAPRVLVRAYLIAG